jgi:hypothetical protein
VLLTTKVRANSNVFVTVRLSGSQATAVSSKLATVKLALSGPNLALGLGLGHDGKASAPASKKRRSTAVSCTICAAPGAKLTELADNSPARAGAPLTVRSKLSATLPVLVTVTSQVVGVVGSTVWLAGLMATLTPRSITSAVATAVAPTPSWSNDSAVRVIG